MLETLHQAYQRIKIKNSLIYNTIISHDSFRINKIKIHSDSSCLNFSCRREQYNRSKFG